MYLRSIDMQGFKSFPDKIKVTFDDGITAIVGPNGSGKSNICDAIRWVLGEQSTKTLRGLKMEDVVFNGTQKRPAVGFAEVSLTIDNKAGILKSDYDEITVTRRFYRSGEREYFINRTQVRLKDVHELFMDTGLGRDGYSIVGQGRIAEILSVKSEDRRQIFEEAAGITKYRTRKEESERKLSYTEDNIIRINDIVAELEGRIEPLSIASQKAMRYLEFYEELKSLELNVWLSQIENLNETAQRCGKEYDMAQAALEKSQTDADDIDRQIEQLYDDMRTQDAQAEQIRGQNKESEQQIAELTSQKAVWQNEIKNNSQNIDRIQNEIEQEQDRTGSIDEEIAAYHQKIRETEAEIRKDEENLNSFHQSSGDLLSKEQGVEREISQMSVQLAEQIAKISDLKIAVSASEATLSSLDERTQTLDGELAFSESEKDRLLSELSGTEKEIEEQKNEIEAAGNVYSGYVKKGEIAKKRYDEAHQACGELMRQIDAKSTRIHLLSDLQKDYDGFAKSVKTVMTQKENGRLKGVFAPVSRLVRTEDKYTAAVEIALGGAAQNIVVENEQSAKAAISYLMSTSGGRATFMPLTSVSGNEIKKDTIKTNAGFIGAASSLVKFDPRYAGVVHNLLGRTVVVDNIDNALNMAKQNNYRLRIVTLDGQLFNPGGSITGGSMNKNAGILSRANEIDRLKSELSKLQEESSKKSHEEQSFKQELDKTNAQLEACIAQKTRATQMLEVLQTKKDGVLSNINYYDTAIVSAQNECEQLKQKKTLIQNQNEENRKETEALSFAIDQLNETIEKLQQQKTGVLGLKEELTQKIMDLKLAVNSKQKDLESARQSIEALQEQKEHVLGNKERFFEQINQLNQENDEIKIRIEDHNNLMAELQETLGVKEELIRSIVSKKLLTEQKISSLQRESTKQRNQLLSLQKEYARCESRLAAAKTAEDTILNKMWDSYELSLTGAKKYYKEEMDFSGAPKKITQLKGEIKKLGNVNIDAIEEYKEVKERYTFITAQKDDLLKAKEGLVDIICEMTEKMKSMFKTQFGMINEEFSKTFAELFGGGKGSLALTDPDDVLESGIEINVQPPGKNVKNITLLSGGEQAFVAIAILFAILKVKPTPFCVFDEIEAALDDVNVARFANYIEKYSDKTQFILITHRRGTMEAADMLYGVTMQERGVSKLLSINVNDVEKRFKVQ